VSPGSPRSGFGSDVSDDGAVSSVSSSVSTTSESCSDTNGTGEIGGTEEADSTANSATGSITGSITGSTVGSSVGRVLGGAVSSRSSPRATARFRKHGPQQAVGQGLRGIGTLSTPILRSGTERGARRELGETLDPGLSQARLEDRSLAELTEEYHLQFFETEIQENRFTMDIPGQVLFLSFGCGPMVLTWRELHSLLKNTLSVERDGLRRVLRVPLWFNGGRPLIRLQVAQPRLAKEVFACKEAWAHHVSYYQGLLILLYHLEGKELSLRL